MCVVTNLQQAYALSLSSFKLKPVEEKSSGAPPDMRLPIFDHCDVRHLASHLDSNCVVVFGRYNSGVGSCGIGCLHVLCYGQTADADHRSQGNVLQMLTHRPHQNAWELISYLAKSLIFGNR